MEQQLQALKKVPTISHLCVRSATTNVKNISPYKNTLILNTDLPIFKLRKPMKQAWSPRYRFHAAPAAGADIKMSADTRDPREKWHHGWRYKRQPQPSPLHAHKHDTPYLHSPPPHASSARFYNTSYNIKVAFSTVVGNTDASQGTCNGYINQNNAMHGK